MKKKNIKSIKKNCMLLLESGETYFGYGFGAYGTTLGEICFNTSITGYQEILTDPSYKNQIITFTFPYIGIVGTNDEDNESNEMHSVGCIVNNALTASSNYRSTLDLNDWLIKQNKIGISGVDTRTLTRVIRDKGAFKALIHFPEDNKFKINKLKKLLDNYPSMNQQDLAKGISTLKIYEWTDNGKKFIEEKDLSKYKKKKIIAVIDFGIKNNILNLLRSLNYCILVFPLDYESNKIKKINPVGIFLSNGPGDPKATFNKIKNNLKSLFNLTIPTFGICLGHQILALSFGAKTKKMHHGHRGANHPVKNLKKGTVEITVQNHGFVVEKKTLPKNIIISHISLFDGSISGIEIKKKPFFSVQYHPEASPGPHDSRYLFLKFKEYIETYAQKK